MSDFKWLPPETWPRIRTVDAHAQGEPLRIIVDGFPQPEGDTVLARRRDAQRRFDHLRRVLMWEPRGHADMYGCLVMPPVTPAAHFSVLFLHNDGFSTMCGHGVIAVCTVAAEAGVGDRAGDDQDRVEIGVDTPAGLVQATAFFEGARVREVRFRNVPSFPARLGGHLEVDGIGRVSYDLAFGGAYYAYVEAEPLGLALRPESATALVDVGRRIKAAFVSSTSIDHPGEPDLGFLYGVIFTGAAEDPDHHSRHVCVFADGEVDRSPTGTGVSGRLAVLNAREEIQVNDTIWVESILGSRFSGRIVDTTEVHGRSAVIPEIGGRAYVTGRHEFVVDPADPWREGFTLR